jgi:zinc protease
MKQILSKALLLALVLAAGQAPAKQKEAPIPDLPAYGTDKPLVLPQVKETRLENGLLLWLIERHDLPLVSAYLAVRGGKASDPEKLRGLSELLPDTLVAGTGRRSARRIAEELQGVGAELSVVVGKEVTYLGVGGLASGTDTILEVLADIATDSIFPEAEVKLAIENELQSIIASRSQPEWALNQVFQHRIFGNHPYGFVNPKPEVIRHITRNDLVATWKRRFRPDQAILVMVGDLPAGEMEALARRHFGGWKPADGSEAKIPPAPLKPAPGLLLVNRPGSVQSTIHVGRAMPPAAVYLSPEAHYSQVKAVEMMGLGKDAVRCIPIDALAACAPTPCKQPFAPTNAAASSRWR